MYFKEFFSFTKSKLITFIVLSAILIYFMIQQDQVLGNFAWSGLIIVLVLIYLFLNIFWFSFKDKKHFLIGLVVFIILIGIMWISNYYSAKAREEAYADCVARQNATGKSFEIVACMGSKGYKFYR